MHPATATSSNGFASDSASHSAAASPASPRSRRSSPSRRRSARRAAAARSASAAPRSPSTSAPGSPRHPSSAARTVATSSLDAACSAAVRSTAPGSTPSAYPVLVETTTPSAVLRRSRETRVCSAARAPRGWSSPQSSSMSDSVVTACPRASTSATRNERARAPGTGVGAPEGPATVTGPRTATRGCSGTLTSLRTAHGHTPR